MHNGLLIAIAIIFLGACKKPEQEIISGNTIPTYTGTPTLLVENYVNRLFIDLIGREPTDAEMQTCVSELENASLSQQSRIQLVQRLMFSTQFIPADTSYAHAYYQKYYTDNKARFLEGVAENDLTLEYTVFRNNAVMDSLNGNLLAYEIQMAEAQKVWNVIQSKKQLRLGEIDCVEMCRRMSFNSIYDDLNMGSFNYINSCFDHLLFRYPTTAEFVMSEPAVESSLSGQLFGITISNKLEFLNALLLSQEYYEGMIRWVYLSLLSREPTSAEVYTLVQDVMISRDIKPIQQRILISAEYAGF